MLKRVFRRTLSDELARRGGAPVAKVDKPEAVLRRLIVGTIGGHPASTAALLLVAEATGQFDQPYTKANKAAVLLRWLGDATPSSRAGRG
jgi:hypothetical protein